MSQAFEPDGFAEQILGLKLYPWQRDVLRAMMPVDSKVTLRAANESGKTSMIAAVLVVWHLALFPNCKVVCTSGVWRQIVEQLWGHLRRYGLKLGWKVTQDSVENPTNGARAIGFSTTEEGKFEGFHAYDHIKEPLFMLFDESKTIEYGIYRAGERCRPTRWLIMSSPGAPNGGFYDYCNDSRFQHFKVTAFDCPHLGQAKADELAKVYGRDSLLYKSMIEAEWMADPNQLFVCTRRAIDRCMQSKPPRILARQIAAIDVAHAEGGNENVLAVRHGNLVEIDSAFVGSGNASVIVDRIVQRLQLRRVLPSDVYLDGDGMGAIYRDIFDMKGWNPNLWKGSEKAFDSATYYNRSAEAWMNLGRSIERCEIILPADEKFFTQLTSREYFVNEKGKIQLMPKDDAKSPDRADAVAMAYSIATSAGTQLFQPLSDQEYFSQGRNRDVGWMLNHNYSPHQEWGALPQGWNVGI